MKQIDPLSVPLVTLVAPFKVKTLKGVLGDKFRQLPHCKKEFKLEHDLFTYIVSKREVLSVEARCVRVS